MKILRDFFDRVIRRIARRQLSADYAGYLQSLKESWSERDRLKKMWEEVHIENRRLRSEKETIAAHRQAVVFDLLRMRELVDVLYVDSLDLCKLRAKADAVSACGCAICEQSKNTSK